ncbi:hypothetical protein [Streptomyces sp. NPDC059874]|uniref:RCC1 domain-containing protein n=1 Tax=Streptomyces sp. NPDC059874 TaxID=3346983 RepID=UPI00364FB359
MRFAFRSRSVRGRAAAVCTAALLWSGLSPGTWPSAQADDGRSAEPGTALSWGSNQFGQLGDGATAGQSTTPVRVCGSPTCLSPFDRVIAVDAGNAHDIALRADGTVWTWGLNNFGQLGSGTTTDSTTPVQVCAVGETAPCDSFLTGVTAVAAGGGHSLALRTDGTVVAWGSGGQGELGNGASGEGAVSTTPVQVCAVGETAPCDSFLGGVTAIAAAPGHSLALRTDGIVVSWGYNAYGQLGDGTTTQRSTPVQVHSLFEATAISAASTHSLALRADGTVRSWGSNDFGLLGNGTSGAGTQSSTPVQVCAVGETAPCGSFLTGVTAISAGDQHNLVARTDGTALSWGGNGNGQLGSGTSGSGTQSTTPVRVCAVGQTAPCGSFLTDVSAIAAGAQHSLVVRTDGTALSWGANGYGELGNGTRGPNGIGTPARVCAPGETAPCSRFLDGVGAISAGTNHSLAITRPQADVAVDISAVPDSVVSGQNLTYTITVRNHGSTAAEKVVFNDTLPPGARFVSATPTQGSCTVPTPGSSDTVTCSLGTLNKGTQTSTQIVVKVVAARGGTVTDKAVVSSDTPDPNEVNNSASIETAVR